MAQRWEMQLLSFSEGLLFGEAVSIATMLLQIEHCTNPLLLLNEERFFGVLALVMGEVLEFYFSLVCSFLVRMIFLNHV